jgi:sarcosine oxidase, subunit beta
VRFIRTLSAAGEQDAAARRCDARDRLRLFNKMNRLSNIVHRWMQRNRHPYGGDDVSVAIVGAGVVGLSTALHLRERGIDVTLFERNGIGAGASGIQPGGVRQQWGTRANCLMAKESFAFYSDFPERYGTRAKARLDRCGYIFVADREESVERLRENVRVQHAVGISSRLLAPAEAVELVPALNPEAFTSAAYYADDGYFDRPQAVVEAFAEIVSGMGSNVEIDEVRSLARNGQGWTLALRNGDARTADVVVVAVGYDSPSLLAPLGHELPIEKEPRHLFFSDRVRERLLEPLVIAVDLGIAAKHLADGRVLASDLTASGNPETQQDIWRRRIRSVAVDLLPILEFVSLPVLATGYYDMTPDGQPIIDRLDESLWVAAGFSGDGFMVAPVVGRMLADAIERRPLPEWADAVGVERFAAPMRETEAQVI